MTHWRLYLDTSVIGGCLDKEFERESRMLLERSIRGEFRMILSDLVLQELERAPPAVRRIVADLPEGSFEYVVRSPESHALLRAYLEQRVVGSSQENDAHHVALATLARVDAVVSWNFKDLVQWEKAKKFSGVNLLHGHGTIDIRSPREFIEP